MRILMVEDNAGLAASVRARLTEDGFVVDVMGDVADAEHAWTVYRYDAVVLDIMLPDGSGLDLLRRMRRQGRPEPAIMLTALDGVRDRVAGLDVGADDYRGKPFDPDELVARLKALLRRPGAVLGDRLSFADVAMDVEGRRVAVGDVAVPLTRGEFLVLQRLLRNQGRVTAKEALADSLYTLEEDWSDNAVQLAVSRLRRKLAAADSTVTIRTLRGLGYMLAAS
jgi:DNA-binding response OmpR family regulator